MGCRGRLADPGHALEQQVAAAEDGGQDQAVQLRPAQQHAVELVQELAGQVDGGAQLLRPQQRRGGGGVGGHREGFTPVWRFAKPQAKEGLPLEAWRSLRR
jgi:hypothetical protein